MTSPAFTPPGNHVAEFDTFAPVQTPQLGVAFLTSLNHAIRTPMSGILGLSELMLEDPTDAENGEYLLSIRSCAAALNDLLSATLDYASHAAGAIRLEEQDFLLNTAVAAGLRDARQRAEDNGTLFEPEFSDGLDRVVRSDALRLRDLIGLIARVAIHSASNGRVRCRITLDPWGPYFGELTLKAWRETNAGPQLEQVPFGLTPSGDLLGGPFRIENLECALIYRIVKLLRGHVLITSEPLASIAIEVVLPIELRATGAREPRRIESSARPSVLISDDNQVSLRVLSTILNRADFESVTVCSGQAAIEALTHRNFDLVLLDLVMPGMEADVTTGRIRRLPHCTDIPIVGITAGATEEVRERCLRNGMDAILGKPVDAEELAASMHFHLSRAASGRMSGKMFDRLI